MEKFSKNFCFAAFHKTELLYYTFTCNFPRFSHNKKNLRISIIFWSAVSTKVDSVPEIYGQFLKSVNPYPAGIYLFKVSNENGRTICEINSVLTLKTLERRQRRCFLVSLINFKQISDIGLFFPLKD